MDKYFQPKIEDLRIGYECEIRAPKYEGKRFVVDEHQMQYAAFAINGGFLFTPYLTKEQIEAEGWIGSRHNEHWNWTYKKGDIFFEHLENNNFIRVFDSNHSDCIFSGQCKDINTFKYICKLLNIE